MLIEELKDIIPSKFREFSKLVRGDPYHFDKWGYDKFDNFCLYYWFWDKSKTHKNKKRVIASEIEKLVQNTQEKGYFDKKDFNFYCPMSASAGPCGYAVIGRILENFEKVEYSDKKFIYK